MTTLLDTSVLIDVLRGNEPAMRALSAIARSGELIVASVLTKTEVLAGVRGGEHDTTQALLDSLDWIAVDETLAEDAGRLANVYVRTHPGIDVVDYVIAATAIQLDAALWTRNVRHFPMIEDLAPPY